MILLLEGRHSLMAEKRPKYYNIKLLLIIHFISALSWRTRGKRIGENRQKTDFVNYNNIIIITRYNIKKNIVPSQ